MAQKTKKVNNIGIAADLPKEACDDKNCPFHGSLKVRSRVRDARVISSKMDKTVIVGWETRRYVPKYERYEKQRTKINAHNPPCIDAKEGDLVKIAETRPLSKTVHNVVIEIIKE